MNREFYAMSRRIFANDKILLPMKVSYHILIKGYLDYY